jgi:hypothetical protein
MKKSENVPNTNTAVGEAAVQAAASVNNGQAELLQWLSDKVVHDAQELATRINKEAELESARLIKAVIWQAQEFINKAQRQVEAAAETEERPSVKVQEDIAKHTMGVVAKILDELVAKAESASADNLGAAIAGWHCNRHLPQCAARLASRSTTAGPVTVRCVVQH